MSEEVKEKMKQLLTTMEIDKVVFIDDEYAKDKELLPAVISACRFLNSEGKKSELKGLFDIEFNSPEDVWGDEVREKWANTFGEEKKKAILRELSVICKDISVIEELYISKIQSLFESKIFVGLTPKEWEKNMDKYLKSCTSHKKLLLIFDKELDQPKNGNEYAKEIISKYGETGNIFFGVLTHTIKDIKKEYTVWQEEFGEELKHIYPLSKSRLIDDESTLHGFKIVVLNYHCNKLKEHINKEISQVNLDALKKLESMDISHFDRLIFKSSLVEGAFELDTLLRIYYLFHMTKAREKFRQDRGIITLANQIRKLGAIATDTSFDSIDKIRKIQQMEHFDSDIHINKNHLPIDLGDIFKVNDSYFILLAQPCSLIIRNDGKRKPKWLIFLKIKEYNPTHKHLIKTIKESIKDHKAESSQEKILEKILNAIKNFERSKKYYPLDYFDEKNEFCVDFSKINLASLDLLDLCVFNINGIVEYQKDLKPPANFTHGWQNRFDILMKHYQGNLVQAQPHNYSDYLSGITASPTITKENIKFPIQRIGRLKQPWSLDLLIQFSNYISRLGFEHDLTRVD